jgi:hypothetical protein
MKQAQKNALAMMVITIMMKAQLVQSKDMIKTTVPICANVLLFMFLDIPYPELFIL